MEAGLDIHQFTKIIVRYVLYYNNNRLENYKRDKMMIADDVNPTPRELWEWGIANRSGKLKSHNEEIVKLSLLPADTARVTAQGIKFKNMYYSCDKAIKENWFGRARSKGTWVEKISYDPRNMNLIYLRYEDGKSFEQCILIDNKYYAKYADRTLAEIEYLDVYEKRNLSEDKKAGIQSKVELIAAIKHIVQEGTEMTNAQKDPLLSKAGRIKGIRENRRNEKQAIREEEAFVLGEKPQNEPARVIPLKKDGEDTFDSSPSFNYLKQKQKERLNKKNDN